MEPNLGRLTVHHLTGPQINHVLEQLGINKIVSFQSQFKPPLKFGQRHQILFTRTPLAVPGKFLFSGFFWPPD